MDLSRSGPDFLVLGRGGLGGSGRRGARKTCGCGCT